MFRSNRKIKKKHRALLTLLIYHESGNQLWGKFLISMFRSNRKIKKKHRTLLTLLIYHESGNQLWGKFLISNNSNGKCLFYRRNFSSCPHNRITISISCKNS